MSVEKITDSAEDAARGSLKQPGSVASRQTQSYNPEDVWDGEDEPSCPDCGGEGMVEYNDAGPSVWGEDCPSEMNHLVTCPNCKGSGQLKDCSWC